MDTTHSPSSSALMDTTHSPSSSALTDTTHSPSSSALTDTTHNPSSSALMDTTHNPSSSALMDTTHSPSSSALMDTTHNPSASALMDTTHSPSSSALMDTLKCSLTYLLNSLTYICIYLLTIRGCDVVLPSTAVFYHGKQRSRNSSVQRNTRQDSASSAIKRTLTHQTTVTCDTLSPIHHTRPANIELQSVT